MSDVIKSAVPPTRFPEFAGESGWQLTTIGDIGNFYYGKSAPKWSLDKNAPTPCVRYGELYTKFGAVITETYSRTNIDVSNLRFSKGGEILVPRVGEKPEDFGKCCSYLTLKNIAIGEMISVFETEQNPLFYTYYFRNMYKEFAKVVEGQNVKNLYYNQLEPLPIYRPANLKEQQKIADCLSSLDDLITAQNQKVEALKQHKKGLMQQLFPAEGETVPKLRFPEFENDGEWFETALENCLDYLQPTPYLVTDTNYNDLYNTPVLTAGKTFILGYTNEKDGIFTENLPVIIFDDFTTASQFVDFPFKAKSSAMKILLAKNGANIKFIYELLQMIRFEVGAHERHWISTFVPMKVLVPSPEEQSAIASCLSSLDDLIVIQTQTLDALKTHKKGLMQQLFPLLGEV